MSEFMGWQKHLNLRKESVWGIKDGGNPDIFIPYNEYSVAAQLQSKKAAPFCGLRQQRHNIVKGALLGGNLGLPLWGYHVSSKSIAEYLIEWAMSAPAGAFLDSYTAEIFEANTDNKRHLGLRVASMSLTGDPDNDIAISLALQGQSEVGGITPPALSPTSPQPVEFTFDLVKFYLSDELEASSASGSGEEVEITNFSLTVTNPLAVKRVNSFWPGVIGAGVRDVAFQFGFFKTSNTYDVLRRSSGVTNRAGRLELYCPHLGTGASGTHTRIDIHFDRLNFANATDQAALNDLAMQNTDWVSLKPNTTDDELKFHYGLVTL